MKRLNLSVFILFLVSSTFFGVVKTHAASVVGNESYEVSWHGIPSWDNGSQYQVYYGQVDGNREANTVFQGLSDQSHSVRLNNLKPCTQYSWSLKSKVGDTKFTWVLQDRRFTTGGTCPTVDNTPKVTSFEHKQVTVVGNSSAVARWSTVNGARFYNVYYKVCGESANIGAVTIPDKGNSVEIKYLDPAKNYCYKVGAMVGNKEVFGTEQQLTKAVVANKPVLGVVSQKMPVQKQLAVTNTVTNLQPNNQINCTNTGKVTVTWTQPTRSTVVETHILYGVVGSPFQHAVRNLSPQSKQLTIGSLNTCKTYNFQPIEVELGGKTTNLTVQTLKPVN